MGIVLFFIASILWVPVTLINLCTVLITHAKKHGFLKVIDRYFFHTAIDIDRFGNRNFRTLLNLTLQKNGVEFGDERETISSVLGKNQRDKTLTRAGRVLCWILDTLDPNHCENSIQEFDKLQNQGA